MKLNPPIPPGRSNRKARAFSAEIARLSQEGYGCKAIHQALASAGMTVSKSTVQREVARLAKSASPAKQPMVTPVLGQGAEPPSIVAIAPNGHCASQEQRTSKDVAEAFLKGRITNPLFRKRI